MEMGWAISEITFMGVMTTMGSVKPFSQPRKPLFLMLLYQMMTLTISAHTSTQLKSAVEERRNPVRPIKEPQMELKNMVATKGIQWALCAPMVSTTILWSIITAFSTMTCRPSGRFFSLLPSRMLAVHRKMVTIRWETVVWVMGMPPKMGMVK